MEHVLKLGDKCPCCDDGEVHVGSSVPDDEGWDKCPACGGTAVLPTLDELIALRQKLWKTEGDLQAAAGEPQLHLDEVNRLHAWLKHIEGGDNPCTDESQLRQWAYEATVLRHPAPGT